MIQVCPLEWAMSNNKINKQMIPDATQWSYSNLTNKKRIPDTNRWIYTNLLKQKWISEATQWTYTNLLKQNETWIPDANLSGLIPISNI